MGEVVPIDQKEEAEPKSKAPHSQAMIQESMAWMGGVPGILYGTAVFADSEGRTFMSATGKEIPNIDKEHLRDVAMALGQIQRRIIDEIRRR